MLDMSTVKLKAIGSDKQKLFIKKMIVECVCKVHEEFGDDLEDEKNSSHLIQSIMDFIETYIATSKFAKEKFDKKKILYLILNELYKGEFETETDTIENIIRHIIDNDLVTVTKQQFFLKLVKSVIGLVVDVLKQ